MTIDKVKVAQGAVAKRLETIKEKGALRNTEVASLLCTRAETVSRWNQGRAYPQPRKENTLLELEYLVDQLSDFYEPNEARQWIFARQRLLDGHSPAQLIKDGRIDDVRHLVNQMRDGVHI